LKLIQALHKLVGVNKSCITTAQV